MNWDIEAEQFLNIKDYPQLVNLYEKKVESEAENVENYLYLGLAYLLNGREEEAQTTWLWVITEVESALETLIVILDQEAIRQVDIEQNNQLACLIRSHLREIAPESINNILRLIDLEIDLKIFSPENIDKYGLDFLVKNSSLELFDLDLLWSVLSRLIVLIQLEILPLLEFCFTHILPANDYLQKLSDIAVFFEQHKPMLALELTKLCLKILPDDLFLQKNLCLFYSKAGLYRESIDLAHQLYEKVEGIGMKVFFNSILLDCLQVSGLWLEYQPIFARHKLLLQQSITEQKYSGMYQDAVVSVAKTLLHSEDNPQENRWLQNNIARLFQELTRSQYPQYQKYIHKHNIKESGKIRVGYIAHTLRTHSVGWLSRWLFEYHDRDQFSIYTYVINQGEDHITRNWFRKNSDQFYNLPCETSQIAEQIWSDEIDILVDLDSLTNNITCQVLSLKPAPIQITWLGLDASGIPSIDYFIGDNYVLPDDAQKYYQEKIWRLPNSYLSVDGFEFDIPTLKREDLNISQDAVIYLNIQNALKRHPDIIHSQMKIVKRVPNSYFLIKGNGDQEVLKELFITIAKEEELDLDRLRFLPRTSSSEIHRANLQIADVVLDTYPYNGATTTLETLWMEVPLVTRVGEQFAARNSYTFMMNAGITEGMAWSDEEYIAWGIKLGTDENLRKEISWKLRQSKKTSPLWNGKQFAREMEKAYQQMWKIYVNQQTE